MTKSTTRNLVVAITLGRERGTQYNFTITYLKNIAVHYKITTQRRVLLEKLRVPRLVKELHFTEPKGSLPSSQQPATYP
jgi:hypothetical protein